MITQVHASLCAFSCTHTQALRKIKSQILTSEWSPTLPWEEGRITSQQEQGVNNVDECTGFRIKDLLTSELDF